MRNLSKDKRDRLILTAVSTLVILIGLWQGVIKMQDAKIKDLQAKIVEQEIQVSNARKIIDNTIDTQRQLDGKMAQLGEIEKGMASGDLYSWIIQKVNTFKLGYKVDIPQFSREVPTEVGIFPNFPYKAAQFNIRGKAYYHDFGKFIADFENQFPYLRIQNVVLEPASSSLSTAGGDEPEDSEKLSFKMEIVTLINPNAI